MPPRGTFRFSDIQWGQDDAKGDTELAAYFVETPDYVAIAQGSKRYIIGRKGTGKTAVLEKIRVVAKNNPAMVVSELTFKTLPMKALEDLADPTFGGKAAFVSVWSFLLSCAFTQAVLKSKKLIPAKIRSRLEEFMSENFPKEGFGFASAVNTLRQRGSILGLNLAEGVFTIQQNETSSVQSALSRDFIAASDFLNGLLMQADPKLVAFVLMDELDEGYKKGSTLHNDVILGLIGAVENFTAAMKRGATGNDHARFRPLLALRSDIFDRLEDNDLNKLDDFVVRLNWNSNPELSHYSLRKVVNHRILGTLRKTRYWDPGKHTDNSDLWNLVVGEHQSSLPVSVKSVWAYIVNRTYERPRDVVKFLKCCQESMGDEVVLTLDVVRSAEIKYSGWLFNELRDEMQSHISVWSEALALIHKINERQFPMKRLLSEVSKSSMLRGWLSINNMEAEYIAETLFNFGVVGNLAVDGVWRFKYKDHDIPFNAESDLIVHYGLYKKFRL